MKKMKYFLIALLSAVLLACGGSDGGSSFYIAPDLTFTVRSDGSAGPAFTTTIGPNGASITLSSGQRLEIGSNTPVLFNVSPGTATIDINTVTTVLWDGVITSPVDTVVTFRIASTADPSKAATIHINVAARP